MTAAGAGVVSPAGELARRLAADLERFGIESKISECEGIALIGIWSVRLAVWCEWGPQGWRFRWCLDDTCERWTYTACPCSAMETAVRRLVILYKERHMRLYGSAALLFGEDES
ncbi:hypothetical protein GBF35_05190 [Nonomuraea phyllanthi]|uniref:hypothetical protein n=1 Tax=Nonomuraea phyllanthi TaxID=2219224 RepID=UPI0012936706|nr:hypothetical protein [Nonomuraea phyllanthi]QFY06150.1 hypothetical protein GBF35_05190 [Nonomuraea phyllanthi]